MRSYRLLVVDDEPHVVDAMISLLEAQSDLSLDIYNAYSGRQALDIMKRGKIDLLISDIQMPDMTGIELVDHINRLWPICKTIFLTAHSNFHYAYEAIRKHVVSYILKSEEDDYIVSEVRSALRQIDIEMNQRKALVGSAREAMPTNKELLFHVLAQSNLSPKQSYPLLSMLGFREPIDDLYLVYGIVGRPFDDADLFTVQDLYGYYMNRYLSYSVCEPDEHGNLIWLSQPVQSHIDVDLDIQMSGTLETIQSSCLKTAGVHISFVFSASPAGKCQIAQVYREVKSQALRKAVGSEPFVYNLSHGQKAEPAQGDLADNTIGFIKNYIAEHITEDVSLMQLSLATGYNSSYISDLFHKTTGESLSRYIKRKKLEMIEKLLRNPELNIEMVCKRAGFNSRPYFNHFIKKETGLTPKNYRTRVLSQEKRVPTRSFG